MNRSSHKLRIYLIAAACAAVVLTVLRTLALTTALDVGIGYFRKGAALSTAIYILEGIFLLAALSLPLFIKRDSLPTVRKPASLFTLIATGVAALATIALIAILIAHIPLLSAPLILSVVTLLFLLGAAIFFGLQFLAENPPPSLLLTAGYGAILSAALLLSLTYFDLYTPMNAPHKVSIHVALLSLMLCLLFDLRPLIGAARPRGHAVLSAIAFLLSASIGISNAVAFLSGVYDNVFMLGIDLYLVACSLFVAARAVDQLPKE